MSANALIALLPILVLGAGVLVVLLVLSFKRHHGLILGLTLAVLALTCVSVVPAGTVAPIQASPLLMVDGYALFYTVLVSAAAFAVALLIAGYARARTARFEEIYVLLLLATLGAIVLAASRHMAALFLGLELLSVSLFGMVAYSINRPQPLEAGIKYLVLGAASSAFLLFGMALLFARTGTLVFAELAGRLGNDVASSPVALAGLALMFVALGFKISVVPFHLWTPDVYQGAPAPVSAFLASVSKTAVVAVLLRLFMATGGIQAPPLVLMLNIVAIASMIGGNLLALLQNDVKRILAYSSVAHLGYLFVAVLAAGPFAVEAVTFYMAMYVVTMLIAFGVVSVLADDAPEAGERTALEDYRGLFWRRPWVAAGFSLALLSLAGIPLTMGFVGKFYLFTAGVGHELWPALTALIIGSVIGLFYYLRVIVTMAARTENAQGTTWSPAASASAALTGSIALTVLTVVLVGLGVYPTALIDVIRASAGLVVAAQ